MKADILGKMLIDIGSNICHGITGFIRIGRSREQKLCQDICNLFGQQCFTDCSACGKGMVNGLHGVNEELYLAALHIEQYRHATYLPDPYYLEALKRAPGIYTELSDDCKRLCIIWRI